MWAGNWAKKGKEKEIPALRDCCVLLLHTSKVSPLSYFVLSPSLPSSSTRRTMMSDENGLLFVGEERERRS